MAAALAGPCFMAQVKSLFPQVLEVRWECRYSLIRDRVGQERYPRDAVSGPGFHPSGPPPSCVTLSKCHYFSEPIYKMGKSLHKFKKISQAPPGSEIR